MGYVIYPNSIMGDEEKNYSFLLSSLLHLFFVLKKHLELKNTGNVKLSIKSILFYMFFLVSLCSFYSCFKTFLVAHP